VAVSVPVPGHPARLPITPSPSIPRRRRLDQIRSDIVMSDRWPLNIACDFRGGYRTA
jgi:hypothetical protein